jgi:putative molybdopterin biosynthesis protein
MDKVDTLHAFQQLKILADARRLDILRRLMAEPATLTQLGQTLNESPAWVRHHIKILETAGLVEIAEIRVTARVTEKYYRARASALLLQELILPHSLKPVIIFSGSHDSAIEHIASQLAPHISLLTLPIGSLDGLINLRQGLCHVAGTHLLDSSGEYNTPFVRHLFMDRIVTMVTLAHRNQGLIVAPGNPKGLKALSDFARDDVTIINRNPGSGTRLWLDMELARLRLPATLIRGYGNFVSTHTAAAKAVRAGEADVAIGIQAAAWETQLGFVPLFEERYDLVIPAEQTQMVGPLLDYLQTASFRKELNTLTGYNTAHSGEQVPIH